MHCIGFLHGDCIASALHFGVLRKHGLVLVRLGYIVYAIIAIYTACTQAKIDCYLDRSSDM